MEVCVSLGLLTPEQAARLKACGVDRVNHNLNTSRRFYPQICTTHTYDDRVATLRAVRAAGLEVCSGGIIGMGEEDHDVVELALQLGALEAESVPVNFLIPIDGTPLASQPKMSPRHCLRVLCLFRHGQSQGRAADGRRPGAAAGNPSAAGAVCGQFPLRRRLPHHQGPTASRRLPDDRGPRVRGGRREHQWTLRAGFHRCFVSCEQTIESVRLNVLPRAGGRFSIDGREYLNFSCNDYLDLSRHPRVVARAADTMNRFGAGRAPRGW